MPELYTTEQAAKILGVSYSTLVHWRLRKKGPRYRKNGSWIRYEKEALIEWAEGEKVNGRK